MTSDVERVMEMNEREKQRRHAEYDAHKQRRNKLLALNAADVE